MKVNLEKLKNELADASGMERKPAPAKCGMRKCHGDGTATTFKDAMSRREYSISGLCQACQDVIFAEPPEVVVSVCKERRINGVCVKHGTACPDTSQVRDPEPEGG